MNERQAAEAAAIENCENEEIERAGDSGAHETLLKPLTPDDLVDGARRLLGPDALSGPSSDLPA